MVAAPYHASAHRPHKHVCLQLISSLLPADSNIVFLNTSLRRSLLICGRMDFTTATISSHSVYCIR